MGKKHPSMTAPGYPVCVCGHYETGHAPRLEGNVGVDMHGACIFQDCDCQRFTFKEFSRHPRSAAMRES